MNSTLGVTITGEMATITLTVPALWLLVLLVLSGVFMTYTTTRDWLSGVIARAWKDEPTTTIGGATSWE